jgi:superfamily II DNA/RNA helicase
VDPPAEHKAYLHRSGRTARAGSAGDVVTVVLPEQRKDLSALMRKAGINVRPQQVTAHCEPVTKLVGEVAPYRAPAPKAAPPARAATAGSRSRRGRHRTTDRHGRTREQHSSVIGRSSGRTN